MTAAAVMYMHSCACASRRMYDRKQEFQRSCQWHVVYNISAYTIDVEDSQQSLKNSSDEVKEAIKSVTGDLAIEPIEKKIQAVVDNLEIKSNLQLQHCRFC